MIMDEIVNEKHFDSEAVAWLECPIEVNEMPYKIWNDKYRYGSESFQQWLDRVSDGDTEIKRLIFEKKFLFGGRTLANRNVPNTGSYSNCYSVGYVEDTLPDIMKANTDIGFTFWHHGGQGLSLSKIRPKGAMIKNLYTTEGIVPFMKMFNTTTETISQGGSRKGALMMSLDVWHPEIETFISIKSDRNEITKANLSVEVNDEFMKDVEDNKTNIDCIFPYEGNEFRYVVNPTELFNKICQNARDHAEPGVLFTNRLRNYNLMEKVDGYQIETTNPCVTGDTQILTNKGYKPIETLVDENVTIWNGYQWSEVTPKVTGQNQDVYQVNFSDGSSVQCTNYHKWVMKDQNRKETKDLQKGDVLTSFTFPKEMNIGDSKFNRDSSRFIQVVSVEYVGKADKVYCLSEPYNHTFIANGVITGNCGEQPLPKHGACNLCSINLSEYVVNPFTSEAEIDFKALQNDIPHIVRAMDDVVSENMHRHALAEQREMAENYRNIGIGIMGMADMFCKLQLKYGGAESLEVIDFVMHYITRQCILASCELAKERGTFPKYDPCMMDSEFAKVVLTSDDREYIRKYGLRNSTFMSIAPTGSIGTMLNIGTGIEPFFRLEYVRTTKSLGGVDCEFKVRPKVINEYLRHIGKDDIDLKDLPGYFVSSNNIDWKSRVVMQGTIQNYVDTGISSTINLPSGTTVETIKSIYFEAWKQGLKGVTVFVDGSREGILTENGNATKTKRQKVHAKPRPKKLDAEYYPVKVKGENFGVVVGYMDDEPYEIFAVRAKKRIPQHFGVVTKVKKRVYKFESEFITIDNMVDYEVITESEGNISLLVSAMLRHEMPVEFIADVVRKTSDSIVSYSSSLATILDKHAKPRVLKDKCPDCGGDLIREGGCTHCSKCDYAKCGD